MEAHPVIDVIDVIWLLSMQQYSESIEKPGDDAPPFQLVTFLTCHLNHVPIGNLTLYTGPSLKYFEVYWYQGMWQDYAGTGRSVFCILVLYSTPHLIIGVFIPWCVLAYHY